MRSPDELTSAFRAQGLKITPQRQLLFRLLHDSTAHPTAESLYAVASAQMPGISLRTVYQTLNDLTAMGELQAFDLGSGATRFDPNVDHHHHVVCRSCSKIGDVVVEGVGGLDIDGLDGFSIETSDIVFRGLCMECAGQLA
ncbi:MAG TPA: transcriptional repressor, partial [Acidimicrobiales bacterium]|nr:transcriptional repressor [Acidimicrobiales bacterium]